MVAESGVAVGTASVTVGGKVTVGTAVRMGATVGLGDDRGTLGIGGLGVCVSAGGSPVPHAESSTATSPISAGTVERARHGIR
jgi:hypothetical protein